MSTTHSLFVQCAVGLERLLSDELKRLGITPKTRRSGEPEVPGGVEVRTDLRGMWAICLQSRLAENVRLRLKTFAARNFDELQQGLRKLPFRAYLDPATAVSIRASCQQSKLWHSGAVSERVACVLSEHVQLQVVQDAAVRVFARVADDQVQISLDVSGARLSQRGYRQHVERASLRESLAAALWAATEEHRGGAACFLWDPFCGAGTIPIEVVHAAQGRLPGANKSFSFELLRNHDAKAFDEFKQELDASSRRNAPGLSLRALGSDSNAKAIAAATHNADSAGIAEKMTWVVGEVRRVAEQIPEGAFVLTNPPYGKRLAPPGDAHTKKKSRRAPLHPGLKSFLAVLAERPDLRPVVVLIGGDARLALPKSAKALFRTKNGGLPVSARLLRDRAE